MAASSSPVFLMGVTDCTQRRFGLRTAWADRWTFLEGCHRSSRSPEPHMLVAIVFFHISPPPPRGYSSSIGEATS
eukprot:7160292-Prymnesium_polylepis.1